MILKKEIEKHAEEKGVPKTTIDKDWVLSHFIDAIFSIPECREKLIFKGGTCLRKYYFKDYRFNEENDKRVQAAWQNSLGYQIPNKMFPEYEQVRQDLIALMKVVFQ